MSFCNDAAGGKGEVAAELCFPRAKPNRETLRVESSSNGECCRCSCSSLLSKGLNDPMYPEETFGCGGGRAAVAS